MATQYADIDQVEGERGGRERETGSGAGPAEAGPGEAVLLC